MLFVVALVIMLCWSCIILTQWHKLVTAKRRAQEEGISVQEAEHHLDSDLFLDEYPWWRTDGPQCPCILQRMFVHAEVVGWKEHERSICWSHWPSVPRANAEAEVPAIQMVGFRTTREEIQGIYNEMYQLKRLLGPPPYGPEQMEALDREICNSLEEQMQCKGRVLPGQKRNQRGVLQAFCGPAARANPPERTWVRGKDPWLKLGTIAKDWRLLTSWSRK